MRRERERERGEGVERPVGYSIPRAWIARAARLVLCGVPSDAGATLTWHVGRYQVLPRHRVDAERRRMCDSPSPLNPFRLSSPLLSSPLLSSRLVFLSCSACSATIALSLSSLHSCRHPRFCTRGDTSLYSITSTYATLALPPPSSLYYVLLPPLSATTSRRRISPWYRYYAANLP